MGKRTCMLKYTFACVSSFLLVLIALSQSKVLKNICAWLWCPFHQGSSMEGDTQGSPFCVWLAARTSLCPAQGGEVGRFCCFCHSRCQGIAISCTQPCGQALEGALFSLSGADRHSGALAFFLGHFLSIWYHSNSVSGHSHPLKDGRTFSIRFAWILRTKNKNKTSFFWSLLVFN